MAYAAAAWRFSMAASAGIAVGAARVLANRAGRARTVKKLFIVIEIEVVVVVVVGVDCE